LVVGRAHIHSLGREVAIKKIVLFNVSLCGGAEELNLSRETVIFLHLVFIKMREVFGAKNKIFPHFHHSAAKSK
jgi:hypothetical protein